MKLGRRAIDRMNSSATLRHVMLCRTWRYLTVKHYIRNQQELQVQANIVYECTWGLSWHHKPKRNWQHIRYDRPNTSATGSWHCTEQLRVSLSRNIPKSKFSSLNRTDICFFSDISCRYTYYCRLVRAIELSSCNEIVVTSVCKMTQISCKYWLETVLYCK